MAGNEVRGLITACSGEPELAPAMTKLLEVLLIKVLPKAQQQERRSQNFFGVVRRTLEAVTVGDLVALEPELWELSQ